jgi:hypothetical protein
MARPLRIEYPGVYYYVINRGLAVQACPGATALNTLGRG